MTTTTIVLLLLLISVSVFGAIEYFSHRRRLMRIPVRIHVNGTRGKSSVTRLIAAGLRSGGIPTCAKTTGTLARMILPDGREFPVFRPAAPNVIEQIRIVSAATAAGAQALVIECMALQPLLQSLSEFRLVRATHAVITNVRPDHLEVMGPGEADVALAMAGMAPTKAVLYTAEDEHLEAMRVACTDRESELRVVRPEGDDSVSEDDLAGFAYVEHAENVALALRVCTDQGVARDVALKGMWEAARDPGAMTEHELDWFGRRITFVNGFAANDPESTERIWQMAIDRHADCEERIAVFNCRSDRPDRSLQLGRACASWQLADHYVLVGTGTYLFARAAARAGLSAGRFHFAEQQESHDMFEMIISLCGRRTLVMGMGNIGGPGLDIVALFKNRSQLLDVSE